MCFCCCRVSPLERKKKSWRTNGETLKVCEGAEQVCAGRGTSG